MNLSPTLIPFDAVPFQKKSPLYVTKEPLSQSPVHDFIMKLLKAVPTSVVKQNAKIVGMDKHGKPVVSRAAVWGADKDGKLAFYATDADPGYAEAANAVDEFNAAR